MTDENQMFDDEELAFVMKPNRLTGESIRRVPRLPSVGMTVTPNDATRHVAELRTLEPMTEAAIDKCRLRFVTAFC